MLTSRATKSYTLTLMMSFDFWARVRRVGVRKTVIMETNCGISWFYAIMHIKWLNSAKPIFLPKIKNMWPHWKLAWKYVGLIFPVFSSHSPKILRSCQKKKHLFLRWRSVLSLDSRRPWGSQEHKKQKYDKTRICKKYLLGILMRARGTGLRHEKSNSLSDSHSPHIHWMQ